MCFSLVDAGLFWGYLFAINIKYLMCYFRALSKENENLKKQIFSIFMVVKIKKSVK